MRWRKMDFLILEQKLLTATFLLLLLVFETCISHSIVELVVPTIADPRETAILSCRYDMDGDRLYCAKWMKDGQEVYRYMPGQRPSGLTFPVSDVKLAKSPRCSQLSCDLELTNLSSKSSGVYRCEVSTEAPTFKIAYKSANMTVAALPQRDPLVEGAATVYSQGDEIRVNCTSDPSLPAADVSWFINDEEATFPYVSDPVISSTDSIGLATKSISLSLRASRWLFRPIQQPGGSPKDLLLLRCVSTMPRWLPGGPHVRQFSIAAAVRHSELHNQKLEWPGSGASINQIDVSMFLTVLAISSAAAFVLLSNQYHQVTYQLERRKIYHSSTQTKCCHQ